MQLPPLTSLQYLAISLLFERDLPTRDFREQMSALGVPIKQTAFSALMRRLWATGLVKIHRRALPGRENLAWENLYQVTDRGVAQWQATRQFYQDRSGPPEGFQPVPSDYMSDEEFKSKLVDVFDRIAEDAFRANRQ